MRRSWRSVLATLALATGGFFAALVVGEVAVRLYEGDPLLPLVPPEPYVDNAILYRTSATRRYDLRPDVDAVVGRNPVRIRINHAGFRDDLDYPEDKPVGTFRILVLGDSFTFAGKVALRETLVKVLEERLQRSDPSRRYEALDLAVPGYNSEQEATALEEVGLRYQPDLVIVAFVLNDALPAGQLVPTKARLPEPVRRVLKRSYLVQFVYDREKQLRSEWRKGTFKGASEVRDLAPGTRGYAQRGGGPASDATAQREPGRAPRRRRLADVRTPRRLSLPLPAPARRGSLRSSRPSRPRSAAGLSRPPRGGSLGGER